MKCTYVCMHKLALCQRTRVQRQKNVHVGPEYLWWVREIVPSTSPNRCLHSGRVRDDSLKGEIQCGSVS